MSRSTTEAVQSSNVRNTGERIVAVLAKGPATTEELAAKIGSSEKDVFSRAWWMSRKQGMLKSTGKGRSRTWQLTAKTAKALAAKGA
jgi:phosphopantetheinyl transferase